MGLGNRELVEAAAFTNEKYPNLDVEYDVADKEEITAGEPAVVNVRIKRGDDEDEDEDEEQSNAEIDTTVHAPFYPSKKMENWWLVVAEEKTRSLLAVKRITVARKEMAVKVEFVPEMAGKKDLQLLVMCDSYVGVDQSLDFGIEVQQGEENDEDGDEDEAMEDS
jgi:pre-mRNA-splicing helicase BRR2